MLRKVLSCTGGLAAILLMAPAGGALAQGTGAYGTSPGTGAYNSSPGTGAYGTSPGTGPYSMSPAHAAEVGRGAPYTDALNALEAKGYASFSNFQEEAGGRYSADVQENGQVKHVLIDPATGQITAAVPAQTVPQIQSGAAR